MAARHPPCRALKPKEKDYKVTDRDGMYVHVTAKGAMSFRMDSRFDSSTAQGKLYRDRYWNDAYLDALAEIHRSCEGHGLDAISVALRWLIHRSQLNAECNDGIIIGAFSLEHLRHNLTAVIEGPLPTEVLAAIDDAALKAQPKWPPYFSGV